MSTNSTTKYTCKYCNAASLPAATPAGEACYECSACGHTVMASVAADALNVIEQPANQPTAAPTVDRAADKARYHLAGGLDIRAWGNAYLVPNGTRGGIVHRVEDGTCSCEAGAHGRPCWHVAAVALIENSARMAA